MAHDLKLKNNNAAEQRQCFCSASYQSPALPGACNVCAVYLPHISTYRRPDFITDGFVAEAKNTQWLNYPHEQIGVFVLGAEALRRPLWLYVRVHTMVDPQLESLVERTGGGVVYYFAVPGYTDPVDQAARQSLVVSVFVFGGCLLTFRHRPAEMPSPARHSPTPRAVVMPAKPSSSRKSQSPVDQAQRKLSDAQSFAERTRQRRKDEIDHYNH